MSFPAWVTRIGRWAFIVARAVPASWFVVHVVGSRRKPPPA